MPEDVLFEVTRPIPGWIPSTPAVEAASFQELLTEHPAVAIHFWAPWNGHDRLLDRSIQEVAVEFAGRVQFMSCNVDLAENQPLCKRCKVLNVPLVAVFVQGQLRRPILGVIPPAQLARELVARLTPDGATRRWWQLWH